MDSCTHRMLDLENYANSAIRSQGKGKVKAEAGRFGELKRGEASLI